MKVQGKQELLVEGREAFPYIIETINNAKNTILINMFIWRDDKIGNKMAEALLTAADRGVKILIVKDQLGSIFEYSEESRQSFFHKKGTFKNRLVAWVLDKFYPMKNKGVKKQQPNNLLDKMNIHPNIVSDTSTNRSDHSKYYIIDDKILILGGINIEDKEIYRDQEGKLYHDYMMAFHDKELVVFFKRRIKEKILYKPDNTLDFIYNQRIDGKLYLGVKEALLEILDQVNSKIIIIMAYIGDKDIIKKLVDMSDNGISIELIIPAKANLQQDINIKNVRELMSRTNNQIKIYLNPKMVHAKLIFMDDYLLTFGSTNLNKQAMYQLAELNVVVPIYGTIKEKLDKTIEYEKEKSLRIDDYHNLRYNQIKALFEELVT